MKKFFYIGAAGGIYYISHLVSALLVIYIISISLISIIIFGFDKLSAKAKLRRVPEDVLLVLALLGGSGAIVLGEPLFNHKISNPGFNRALYIILGIQIVFIIFWISTKFFTK